ncbi:hypothetical protein [Nocardia cyriacigeorgica]|uniref:hypothetical protein n=1 Tax=Nocardia cyriacigeorgica TaxID=135487 RepID=UPI002458F3EA|nr:hypothetical protein [Nocardia cyriacigeorgica]
MDASSAEPAGPDTRGSEVGGSTEAVAVAVESEGRESTGARVTRQVNVVRGRVAAVRGLGSPLRGHWGYLLAAVGVFVTLILMTRPWLMATGPNGSVQSSAFGRINVSTKYLTVWSKSPPKMPQVSGLWAFVTAAAIVLTICVAVLYFRTRTEFFARLVAGASVAVAILVLFTMVYLDSKGAELKALTARRFDLGGQVGQFLSWVKGEGKFVLPGVGRGEYVATSRFTPAAIAAAVIAVASALAAVGQWVVNHGAEAIGLRARIATMREKWDAAAGAVAGRTSNAPAARADDSASGPAGAAGPPADSVVATPTVVVPAAAVAGSPAAPASPAAPGAPAESAAAAASPAAAAAPVADSGPSTSVDPAAAPAAHAGPAAAPAAADGSAASSSAAADPAATPLDSAGTATDSDTATGSASQDPPSATDR